MFNLKVSIMKKTWKSDSLSGVTSKVLLASAVLMAPAVLRAGNEAVKSAPPVSAVQQSNTIKGNVVDETGEPLIGVTVKKKGGSALAITDLDGNFSANVPSGTQLEISYTGYKTVVVEARNGLKVKMQPDAIGLDEMVVIGYGTQKKRDLTGSVVSIKNDDVVIAPTSNVMEALQGKVSGLDITKTSGQVGGGVNILLRGSRSIYGSNSPLFIIDGLPGSYDDLSPNDIESVDVLKDASSTAIYGSAGANGVIIITTKRGSKGKVKVNFDAYYGFSGKAEYKKGMTGDEWVNYYKEAYKYKNGVELANVEDLFTYKDYTESYQNGKWIDWVDQALGNTATTQKYSLSVQGGTDKTNVYASVVYNRDTGLLPNEKQNKYSVRLNIDQKVFNWMKVGLSSNLTYSIRDRGYNKTFTGALTAFPLGDVYDENGEYKSQYISNHNTPMGDYIKNQYENNTRSTYVNAIGYAEVTPLKGLKFRTQFNGTLNHSRQGTYWGALCHANRPTYANSPHAQILNSDGYSYVWENILSYNITIANDHDFGLTGVTSWQKDTSEYNNAEGSGQDLDVWKYWRLLAANSQRVESGISTTQKMSYAVRFNYSYKGKYLFSFSNRWDGVSFFSPGKKWDSFPAAALAWRVSDEKFMKGTESWLDNLKVRIGAGITGNSGGVGAYSTQTNAIKYTSSGITINGSIVPFTQYTGTYGSPSLGWEKSYNWNFGIDFAVVKGRIDGSLDFFTTKTRGLLFKRTMPVTSGMTGWGSPLASWENIAKTSNKGFEFTVNSRNIVTKNFKWNTSLTGTWSAEKIEELPNGDLISENLFVGQPIHAIYDYKYAGIWGTNASQEELNQYGVKPGWVKIETVEKYDADGNSDGGVHKYSQDDRQVLGHENPSWIIGLNNTFVYKDFDLTIYAMGRFGQTIYSKLLAMYNAKSSISTNQISGVDYWTEQNQGAYYPRPGTGDDQTVGVTAVNVYDGSFIKIKNITLGYTLPKSISKHALMEKCRFYFTAYNPWIFAMESKLKGTDPETGGSDTFPTYKQFVFGVNITF